MANSRRTNHRSFLQVPEEGIAALSDTQLRELVGQLFRAEAYKCGASISQIDVSLETKAADDGCDGWTPAPDRISHWLGSRETCWQLKAGLASEPARLVGEVSKAIPKRTLSQGNRFVLIASGCRSGRGGRDKRLNVLIEEAKTQSLPTDQIDALGADDLDAYLSAHSYSGGEISGDGLEFTENNILARVGLTYRLDADNAEANFAGQAMSQSLTPVGASTNVPNISSAISLVATASSTDEGSGAEVVAEHALADGSTTFLYEDADDGLTPQFFQGHLFVSALGMATGTGGDSWGESHAANYSAIEILGVDAAWLEAS